MDNKTLTALPGVKVGHSTALSELTGCTMVLFNKALQVAYCSHGGGPGTFNTETLRNGKAFNLRHGLFITGGSLSGLSSATEIMAAMIADGIGDKFGKMVNPALSGAVIFDAGISLGQYDPYHGRRAYDALSSEVVASGNVGAGTGASIGKFYLPEDAAEGVRIAASKSGIGSARTDLGDGLVICALTAVNALGNVINPDGTILAGNLRGAGETPEFISFEEAMRAGCHRSQIEGTATTVTIVGTNMDLGSRENYERVANLAAHGQVRAINPVNGFADGDTVFVFSTASEKKFPYQSDPYFKNSGFAQTFATDLVGHAAAKVVQESIYDACRSAETVDFFEAYQGILPGLKNWS